MAENQKLYSLDCEVKTKRGKERRIHFETGGKSSVQPSDCSLTSSYADVHSFIL